jgi:hypothetical protein
LIFEKTITPDGESTAARHPVWKDPSRFAGQSSAADRIVDLTAYLRLAEMSVGQLVQAGYLAPTPTTAVRLRCFSGWRSAWPSRSRKHSNSNSRSKHDEGTLLFRNLPDPFRSIDRNRLRAP